MSEKAFSYAVTRMFATLLGVCLTLVPVFYFNNSDVLFWLFFINSLSACAAGLVFSVSAVLPPTYSTQAEQDLYTHKLYKRNSLSIVFLIAFCSTILMWSK